jgi:NhaP-type Na+/H+ or K+/H+ antiporter
MDIRKYASLEFSLMLLASYLPYLIAEQLGLSGILAILFCGIVHSHYTHFNLSTFTQITEQQTFQMMAYVSETIVFVYLGFAVFSFKHVFSFWLVFWTIVSFLIMLKNIFFDLKRFCV